MKLVVDTNVLFTIFLHPRTINKFKDLYSRGIELVISEFVLNLYDLFFLLRFIEPKEELIRKKLKIFRMEFNKEPIKRKIEEIKPKWEAELKPFLLTELTDFEVAKEFVERKLGIG